jgi:Uma2 family endonuclease
LDPRVIFEILSPTTRKVGEKLDEYRGVPSIQQIVLVEPGSPQIVSWVRLKETAWTPEEVAGINAVLALPSVELALPLAEIYADIPFPKA